jgi:protein ImuB
VVNNSPLRFEETIELEYPVDVLEPLAFLLARMLDGLCGRLNARALSTNELRLRMRLEHCTRDEAAKSQDELKDEPIAERKLTLPVPMNDAKLFLKLLQLELSATPPGAPVTQLWLQAEPARPRVGQAGLFMPLTPEPQKLELTLARIHKLLGVRDALRAGSAELLDTHEPDAFRVIRFQPRLEDRENRELEEKDENSNDNGAGANTYLAVRRYRPPFAAEVEIRDGLPVRVMCPELKTQRALHDNVVWAAGPWRSSGNWWGTRPEDAKTGKSEEQFNSINPEIHGKTEIVSEENFWNREEWDIALAITIRSPDRRERETEIGLYRLILDRSAERWVVEGCYD